MYVEIVLIALGDDKRDTCLRLFIRSDDVVTRHVSTRDVYVDARDETCFCGMEEMRLVSFLVGGIGGPAGEEKSRACVSDEWIGA